MAGDARSYGNSSYGIVLIILWYSFLKTEPWSRYMIPMLSIHWYYVENEDVVGAALAGDAPTTSEWSTILLPNRVRLILQVLWYIIYLFGSMK